MSDVGHDSLVCISAMTEASGLDWAGWGWQRRRLRVTKRVQTAAGRLHSSASDWCFCAMTSVRAK